MPLNLSRNRSNPGFYEERPFSRPPVTSCTDLEGHSIVIAHADCMSRGLLRCFFESRGMIVIGETETGCDAVSLAAKCHPDLALLDVFLPLLNGIDAAREIHREDTKIGIIVFDEDLDNAPVALAAGALGFVWKRSDLRELELACVVVANGRPFLSAAVSVIKERNFRRPPASLERLTERQRQVLQLITEEKGNKEIAEILGVSIKTVEKHRSGLMDTLNIHSIAGLVRFAIREHLIRE